jgi:hypothetical protein
MSDEIKIDRYCPKCMSNRIYTDDGFYACRECGNRWIPNFKPYSKVEEEMNKPKPRECVNCGRIKTILGDGLCPGCYSSVHNKFEKGTPEYDQALAAAKKRFSDPDRKQTLKRKSKKLSTRKPPKDTFWSKPEEDYLKHTSSAKSHVKTKGFKHSDGPDIDVVIAMVDAQIEEYKKRLDKLNQAKQILTA